MQRETKLSLWCERILEAGWLLALTLIPIYFNLLSARHFEPDKATTLRAIVLIMAAVGIIRVLERWNMQPRMTSAAAQAAEPDTMTSSNPLLGLWRRLNAIPLAVPVLIYVLVFLIATVTSVVPRTSFWGSYQRLQGTYTNLSYIMLAVMMVATIRRREQLERVISITLITGLLVSFYGIVQHNGFDPLPWQGDVVRRVASTMGNAIFVAAYLIMVVPFAFYRIFHSVTEASRAPESNNPLADIGWAVVYTLLIVGTMLLLVSAITFSASVRVADFRYWWVFPGAIVVSTALWVLPTLGLQHRDRRLPIWPGTLFLVYVISILTFFGIGQGGEMQQVDMSGGGMEWWKWLAMSTIGVVGAHALALSLPRNGQSRPSDLSWALQGVGNFAILISMLLTIFYSQSRGPWLGLSAALFVFFTLFLWLARRRAIQANASFAPSLRTAMWAWIGTSVMGVAFVVMFNVSDAPFFERLRQVPYVGRAGTLMEAGSGTGLVRKLIWLGDEHTGGSIELITSNPVRTVVGWGPESMFVAFNPFYPPSLANVESRSASPDRAHQAILDQMITKGLLGLVSYFFVLISFAVLCWRLIIHSKEWRWQILSIALFSGVAGHFVEGFTGIPIVATLMMLWVIIALTVVAGVITGEYTLGALPEPKPAPEPAEQPSGQAATTDESPDQPSDTAESTESTESTESPASSKPSKPSKPSKKAGTTSKGKKERHHNSDGYTSRGSKQEQRGQSTQPKRQSARPTRQVSTAAPSRGASTYGLYALILVLAIAGSWWFNFSSVYADMKFHEGDTFAAQQGAEIYTLNSYLEAIRINPTEDFYYLNLGRNLMSIADKKREASGQMGQEAEDPEMKDLLRLNNLDATATFVQNQMPMELMSYAEAVLERARELNPLNKDHYANLARLNNFWFNLTNDVERLEKSALWYERANEVAPYDVSLINEHASIRMMLGNLASSRGDTEAMNAHFNRARELYETSLFYDENYGEADTRLAEVYRLLGEHEMAAEMAAQAIRRSPHSFDSLLQPMVQSLIGKPDLLLIIRDAYMDQAEATQDADLYSAAGIISVRASDLEGAVEAYEQAVEIAPESVENNRNYTIVLSDTRRYEQAIDAAQATIELMQETGQEDAEIQQFRWVLSQVERQKERQETPATSEIESWFEGRFGGE